MILGTLLPIFAPAQTMRCALALQTQADLEKTRHLYGAFERGAKDFYLADSFAKKISEASAGEQEKWLQAVGAIYRRVPKKYFDPTAPRMVGGRRLLDRVLTLLERNDLRFQKAQEERIPAFQSYATYLQGRQRNFSIVYSDKDVAQIIGFLKGELQRIKAESKTQFPRKILLAGSFINGKADLMDSDLDLSVNDPALAQEVPIWQERINEILRLKEPDANLKIEMSQEPAPFYGKTNPFVIEIMPDGIRLMVFPPASLRSATDLQPYVPASYPLEFP